MNHTDIFKICILDKSGVPSKYYIFLGESTHANPREFFSNVEWAFIEENSLQDQIFFAEIMIHSDEAIDTIRKKIAYMYNQESNEYLDIRDIYLWGVIKKRFPFLNIYKRLTQQDTKPFRKEMLVQFLSNYVEHESDEISIQDIYTNPVFVNNETFSYETLQEFEWLSDKNHKYIQVPLGMRFIEKPHQENNPNVILNKELFLSNPFQVWDSEIYQPSSYQELQPFEFDFLFHYGGDLLENTIYMAISRDVVEHAKEKKIDPDYMLNLYFPFSDSEMQKPGKDGKDGKTNITLGKNNITPSEKEYSFMEEQSLLDTFYKVYSTNVLDKSVEYKQEGIRSFFLIMHPDNKNVLPLETIFKNLHANIQIPLIQYNPGAKRENVYRVYFEETAQNGNKIPYLSRNTLMKCVEKTGKISNITMFISNSQTESKFIQVSFEQNGNIVIRGELETALMPQRFNVWLRDSIAPAIQQMNDYLQQSGYQIRSFQDIREESIEVVYLTYKCVVSLSKKLDLEKISGYLSPFFYNELSPETKKGSSGPNDIWKRYKRIEYFKKMDPVEEYISELLRFTQDTKLIKTELKKEFSHFTDTKIQEAMTQYQEKHRISVIPGRFTNKKIEILEHSGFRTLFHKNEIDNEWTIEVHDIVLSEYIDILHIYLHSFFMISQNPELVPPEIIRKYKNKKITTPPKTEVWKNHVPISILPIFLEEPVERKENKKEGEEEGEEEEFFLQEEYESEEGEEEDDNSENKDSMEDAFSGGGRKHEKTQEKERKTIKEEKGGASELKNLSNYFTNRIEKRVPLLSESGYARICQASKQPIILTQNEKDKIDKQYSKDNLPYINALEYGKDNEGKPFYYICPKYWCVKPGEEGPLTEEEVQQKKCGEIIKDSDNIKEGEYTYMSREDYDAPGFVNRKVTTGKKEKGSDICYPCCYKNWSGDAQKKMRNQCNPEKYPITEIKKKKIQEKQENLMALSNTRYIYEMNRVPLLFKRMGELPFAVQMFLNVSASNVCIDSSNMPKLNCPFFVRYGVIQPNSNQYFLSCLADIYSYQRNQVVPISITEMRNVLRSAISIDKFVQLHNASLVALFHDTSKSEDMMASVSLESYKDSLIYNRVNLKDDTQLSFLEYTVLSYENFRSYLEDNNAVIDHTYLWEAICEENPLLFPRGLNLAILEILNHDSTNNIELLCPTANYHTPFYDPKKETLLLVKQNEVYEPVYLYEIKSFNPEISSYKKTFKPNSTGIGNLSVVLQMMYSLSIAKCAPTTKKQMTFQRNHSAKEIQKIINGIAEFTI